MKQINVVFIAAFFIFLSVVRSQHHPLSEQATISLLTCSPGREIYEVFGHCAIRIVDPVQAIDRIYNYGTFDFDAPNFYWNFIRGKLNYCLSTDTFSNFKNLYLAQHRSILEQVLNLDPAQKNSLFFFLENNALPDRRNYLYDFFFNNCATKIRDAFRETIQTNFTRLEFGSSSSRRTFRQLIRPYLTDHPWYALGINLGLGLPVGRPATSEEEMFLPDYLFQYCAAAKISQNNTKKPLVRQTQVLASFPQLGAFSPWYISPLFTFCMTLLLYILILFFSANKKWFVSILDFMLFFLLSLSGMILAFLWLATDHQVTRPNLNLLWTNPLDLIAAISLFIPRWQSFSKYCFRFIIFLMLFYLLALPWLPQSIPLAVLPLLILVCWRGFMNSRFLKKTKPASE